MAPMQYVVNIPRLRFKAYRERNPPLLLTELKWINKDKHWPMCIMRNLYWATRREQFELLNPPAIPERIRPSIRVERWGEEDMMIQPRAPGIHEVSIVLFGPNLPPQYPPRRFPMIKPMRKLLAEIMWKWKILEKHNLCFYLPNQDRSSSVASMLGIWE